MSDSPFVSVLLRAGVADSAALDRSIRSVLAQTDDRWELVVAAKVGSRDQLARWTARDARVRAVAVPNDDPTAAWGAVGRAAGGVWVVYLEGGDQLYPDHLDRVAAWADRADALVFGYDGPRDGGVGGVSSFDPASPEDRLATDPAPLGVAHRRILGVGETPPRWRWLLGTGVRIAAIAARSGQTGGSAEPVTTPPTPTAPLEPLDFVVGTRRLTLRLAVADRDHVMARAGRLGRVPVPPRLVRRPAVVVDVGAGTGWFAARAALVYGPGAVVHTFESDPGAGTRLRANLGWLGGVHIHPFGLGPGDGPGVRDAAAVWDWLRLDEVDVLRVVTGGTGCEVLSRLGARLGRPRVVVIDYSTEADRRWADGAVPGHVLLGADVPEPGQGVLTYARSDLLGEP